MHICFAIPEYLPHPGGIATYYAHLVDILSDAGHQVTVLTTQDNLAPAKAPHLNIVDIAGKAHSLRPSIARLLPHNWSLVLKVLTDSIAARDWLRNHASETKIDIVACTDFLSWGGMLNEPDLPPVAITCHGSHQQIIHYSPGREIDQQFSYIQSLEALSLLRADGINAYSPQNAEFWEPILERTVTLTRSPWVLTQEPQASRKETSTPKGVVIGRLQTWKGAEVLARALALLNKKNFAVHIDWYGGDTTGPDNQTSMAQYLTTNYPEVMNHSLHYHGVIPRETVTQKQIDADFILVPSTWDTFNFTVLEALEKGKPTILSDACGAAYLVESGTHGLVFASNQETELAKAIERICSSHSVRSQLGNAAYQHIHDFYTPDKIIEDHLTFFQSTVERRKQHPIRNQILGAALSPLIDSPLLPEAMMANLGNFPTPKIISGISDKIKKRLLKD